MIKSSSNHRLGDVLFMFHCILFKSRMFWDKKNPAVKGAKESWGLLGDENSNQATLKPPSFLEKKTEVFAEPF